ncbi:hypothetical protein BGX26_011818 [Mortierella sp. AD094]|nr:hypothetical protein BGX26_011818 [Mortierella sp. AD094]
MSTPRNFPREVQPALALAVTSNDPSVLQVKPDVVDMTPRQPEDEIQIGFEHVQAQAKGQDGGPDNVKIEQKYFIEPRTSPLYLSNRVRIKIKGRTSHFIVLHLPLSPTSKMFKSLAVVSTLLAVALASCDRSTAVSMPYDINLYGQPDCLGANYGLTYKNGGGHYFDNKACSLSYPTVGFHSVLIGSKCQIVLKDVYGNIVRNWPGGSSYYFEYGNIPTACAIEAWCRDK